MQKPVQILRAAAVAAILLIPSGYVWGQSHDIMPRPIPPPFPGHDIRSSTDVDARLDGTILQVACEQTFVNEGGRPEEIEILLPIPPEAVVTDGLLLADGREYAAEVLPADQARAIYEDIVRRRRDPALLELAGHGLIRLSAFPIPPGGRRTVSFRYHQSVQSPDGRTRLLFPVAALCGLDRSGPLALRLAIEGREPLAQVYSPSHDLEIERTGPYTAVMRFASDRPDPHETMEVIVVRDAEAIGVDLRTARSHGEDDYFLLAVSPGWDLLGGRRRQSETVSFVLDRSGSMQGEKFDQARRALRRFLDEVSPEDHFNLIAFSNDVQPLFEDGPRRATAEARRRAREWLDDLKAGGGTALAEALDQIYSSSPEGGLVLLLTDGRPTVGEQNPEAILRRAAREGHGLRFYAFGVGYDVDALLLDDLARQGGGSVSYVRPGENVEEAVTTLRRRVEHPCARNVHLEVRGAEIEDLFPRGDQVLFADEPLLFAGRVRPHAGRATVHLMAETADGRPISGSWNVDFDDPEARSSAVPVLWASRKAASLIETIRREGHDDLALDELRELSKRYGILNEEVALLARENEPPMLAQRDVGAPPQYRQLGGGFDATGHKGASMAPSAALAARQQVDLSAKAWDLSAAESKEKLERESGAQETVVTAGELSFRREGEVWSDTRLADPVPKGTRTIRVRAYGAAYFQLASGSERLAAWLAVGEQVRVLLPGILLEVGPDGEDSLPDATITQIREVAEQA